MTVKLDLDTAELAQQYDVISDKQYQHGLLLLNDLHLKHGHRVLDVGCGTGRLTAHAHTLVGSEGRVVGIDPLSFRVDIARLRAKPGLEFAVGQAEDLSEFADGSFDAVYLNSVFHWLPHKAPVLAQAWRVLRPGGRLAISSASAEQPHDIQKLIALVLQKARAQVAEAEAYGSTPHKVSVPALRVLLDAAGFIPLHIQVRHFDDVFPDAEAALDFSRASAFGNFFAELNEETQGEALRLLREELGRHQEADGIHLYRHLIFAIAEKPLPLV